MQAVHDLLHASGIIPPVNVEDIDIARSEFLERSLDRDMQGLDVITGVMSLLVDIICSAFVICGVLGRDCQ